MVLNADMYSDSYIREFAFDGEGIFNELAEKINCKTKAAAEKVVYSTAPFQYAVKYTQNNEIMFYNTESGVSILNDEIAVYGIKESAEYGTVSRQSENRSGKEDYRDAFFYGYSLASYMSINDKIITDADNFVPRSGDFYRDGTNEGNCGPTTATNYCGYIETRYKNGILELGNLKATYAKLVDALGFDRNGTGISGVTKAEFLSGLRSYVNSRGLRLSMDTYRYNYWSDYTRDFSSNKPVVIFISGDKYDNGEWTTGSHVVLGVGFRIMNDDTRYIRVYDAWYNSHSRFVNFHADSITSFEGVCVTIS